jgi:tRNA nucleotidyltransferase (CCA-adding enzyme)
MLRGLPDQEIKVLCGRYKVPREYKDLAVLVARYIDKFKRALSLNATELVDVLEGMDAFRRVDRFKKYLQACLASERDIVLAEKKKQRLLNALKYAQNIDTEKLIQQGFSGEKLRAAIKHARLKTIEKI